MAIADKDLDLSGILGLDFVNTVVRTREGPVDLLETPDALLDWMTRVEATSSEAPSPGDLPGRRTITLEALAPVDLPGLRLLTVEARQLRSALVALFRWVADSAGAGGAGHLDGTAAFTIDRALRAASPTYHLAALPRSHTRAPSPNTEPPRPPGAAVRVQTRFDPDGPLAALTPIALSAVEVAGSTDPGRLRDCDAEDCTRWFVDTSKGGRRRWCSMARCGNRAKAARYRRRRADEE